MKKWRKMLLPWQSTWPGIPRLKSCGYLGFPHDPGYKTAFRQMHNGFGGLMSFDVGNDIEHAKKFIENLKVIIMR